MGLSLSELFTLDYMTHIYRELLLGLHKAGNGVPDFNTFMYVAAEGAERERERESFI